ncbi:MAG TPA: polysaccharide deacetylase family protein [Candidatus Limnocylindrales bacterium]|nr:polysaccharide deacetylase family protein [Candidatus Limnocylindrales bacterium]
MKAPGRAIVVSLSGIALGLLLAAGSVVPSLASAPSRVVSHGPSTRHAVALTFDDAWDPPATRTIFDILRTANAPATFFPVADGVARDRALWRTIANAGYPIGNHSVSHPDLTTLGTGLLVNEIASARRTIEGAIGHPMAPLLRPPYGLLDDRVRRVADDLGFPTLVLWDVASSDWADPDPAVVVSRSLAGSDGSIVLLHVGPASTIAALPSIIAGYRSRGFELVTIGDLLGE